MRIRLVREGGLAGISKAAVVDTELLDASRARELRGLIEAATLEEISPPDRTRRRGPDRFRYTLTIDEKGRETRFSFSEEEAPDSVHRLVQALWSAADSAPPPDVRQA